MTDAAPIQTNSKQVKSKKTAYDFSIANISENALYQFFPEILDILLRDRTASFYAKKKRNIIWANNNYQEFGEKYQANCQINTNLITGEMGNLIVPRALKSKEQQKERTKSKAEVFTPSWVVKKQNDALDENFLNEDLITCISRTWLEITCGEAPYMANRYEMTTGKIIPINERVGFVDKKLKRINQEIHHKKKWQEFTKKAYQTSFGFEWNGDSLLLARENLLFTYRDYYFEKWKSEPEYDDLKQIAQIISYNIFQMDGLTQCIPLTQKREVVVNYQGDLFVDIKPQTIITHQGWRVKIKDWKTKKMVDFMEYS
ncbi:Uncharacterised protein [Moraxella lacunata]|uniref:Uncharacterized protein n=1 Tax=Moraxella lacunata TaxID=477 RepID=A0A378QML4_MORLA|nr:restriction endonuclease [Moraxella lacunata]STZ01544.1 Uncharacterised protein [Moraxella lacunata]